MSSRLENTSAILGEYMLKGWTLTDLHCDTCNITPLMREPNSQASREGRAPIQFCALCDGGPAPSTTAHVPIPSADALTPPAVRAASAHAFDNAMHLANSSAPTHNPSRGEASADRISSLLLQGYSLLNENCPAPSCQGIPLVGYPRRKDGSKDGRKMCVSCGGRWVSEGSMDGMTLAATPAPGGSRQVEEGAESPRSKKRRELYEVGTIMREEQANKAAHVGEQVKGKARATDADEEMGDLDVPSAPLNSSSSLHSSLHNTTASLASTLDRLASSLSSHTSNQSKTDESRYFVDVKLHTEAMRDVLAVLGMVEKLRK